MAKTMYERSSDALAQDGQGMRFSDEVSVAEVARLMDQVRHFPAALSGFDGRSGNEFRLDEEWLR